MLLVVFAGHVSEGNTAVHLKKRENCGSCQWKAAAGRPGVEDVFPAGQKYFYFS